MTTTVSRDSPRQSIFNNTSIGSSVNTNISKGNCQMIKGLEHVGTEHRCNVCSCEFTDDEGGVLGYFGILPVAFCPTCYSSMVDMVQQDLEIGVEE
jgi:hypothetical protein